jgi:hypothetical protein
MTFKVKIIISLIYSFPNFIMHLILVSVVLRYLNFETFTNDLLHKPISY